MKLRRQTGFLASVAESRSAILQKKEKISACIESKSILKKKNEGRTELPDMSVLIGQKLMENEVESFE